MRRKLMHIKYIEIFLVVVLFLASSVSAFVVCGDNIVYGSNIIGLFCGVATTTTTTSTTITTTTTTTTTTLNHGILPPIVVDHNSRQRNMSYDQYNPKQSEYCDPIVCGFLNWFVKITQ